MIRMLGLWVVLLLAISSIMWASNSDYKAVQERLDRFGLERVQAALSSAPPIN